ncbi:peptide-methionine (S)-S-oxide reductase MsrA [Geomonas nitrogeniifigens]|uniref:Peptide methionine sulfoxide reductase MsrA n=1 Tax=Geomonas diazotrophica TaxID=2843197 RepID=A0ABX8JE58_9BACT|nr:peptide-methionine (S)-S-oxide reductase MsrA [Geomonas nitrogeniifigens]QWV96685.1 peptide-methionine (S)-S-oxide reductase MsrA [Geomonas nitrogeniifigens]QXE85788.1 peptide-methionine (S)-S-oxide reductase MsrA [Geomonas nitrogeniifigens]
MENSATDAGTATAIFAGGCFWCMEPVFDRMPGVLSVLPGYTGGSTPDPSYREVCQGDTGHVEAVQIVFDPAKVSYRELLRVFWRNIDPTTKNRQFCDYGSQYQTAIFYLDEEQKREAEESREDAERSNQLGAAVVTEILPASEFYPAEEYHRQYYQKEPYHYQRYHEGCGRNWRLKELWGREKE